MTSSLARRERLALCALALELGGDAPTKCEGWDVKDLVVHLLVRERSPIGALGMFVPPLAPLHARATSRLEREALESLVSRLRSPSGTLFALPGVEQALNTLEYFVHHEDVRRAQPGWQPRELSAADESLLWGHLKVAGRGLVMGAGLPVEIVRSDDGRRATLRGGADPVVLEGLPSELALRLYGRPAVGVEVSGPPAAVARFEDPAA